MNNNLLVKLQAASSPQEREWLILEHNLHSLPEKLQHIVWAAAIPHWFERDFLNSLLAREFELDEQSYQTLLNLSYVEEYSGRGYCIHERSRALLLAQLWQQDEKRYRKLSLRAWQYSQKQNGNDTLWRVEQIYHLLVAKPDKGVDQLINQGEKWWDSSQSSYGNLEVLARAGREHTDAQRLTQHGVIWTLLWEVRLDYVFSRLKSARSKLDQIKSNYKINVDSRTKAFYLELKGDVHLHLSEYKQGQNAYTRARAIYAKIGNKLGEVNCIMSRGNAHFYLSELNQAQDAYIRAGLVYDKINNRQGKANCIKSQGDVHLHLSEYKQAQDTYIQALRIYVEIGNRQGEANCIRSQGDVYLHLSEYKQAQDTYIQALQIYVEIGNRQGEANCIFGQGVVHFRLSEYTQAQDAYTHVYLIYTKTGDRQGEANCIKAKGDVLFRLGEYKQAQDTYMQAQSIYVEIDSRLGNANCLESQANLHLVNKQREKSISDFQLAAELYKSIEIIDELKCLAMISLIEGNFEKSIDYFNQYKKKGLHELEGLLYLAFALQCNKETDNVVQVINILINKIPNEKALNDTLNNIANIAESIGHEKELIELSKKIQDFQGFYL